MKGPNLEFSVNIYGKLEQYNQVLSKARCRIFYKYGNRNGTYITDEFAEKLLATLPYSPVKGIYEYDDYTDHGERRDEGRIYGIVPEQPNISWEAHLDEDGIERIYACADVLIFTALYEEAVEIVGKSQSMEIYEPSIKFHKEIIEGQSYYVFDEGCFLGLQVLGEDVEPCFEGASFYTLQNSIEEIIKKIEEVSKNYTRKGGQTEMSILNFKLSDREKFDFLWELLNDSYNQEGGWSISYTINDIYDEYALVYNYEEQCFERVYYTKDDENNSLAIDRKEKVFVMDITENEKNTLDTLRRLNGDTYELVSETLENAEDNKDKILEFSAKIEELENANATLKTENVNAENLYSEIKAQNEALITDKETLVNEIEDLKQFKLSIEKEQKEAIIAEYEEQLTEEIISSYREKIDEYTAISLDKELAYELKKNNPSVFTKKAAPAYVPKNDQKDALDEILSKYRKN